ncbi:alpha/beta fold hydrolase [Telmatobacter bradus]|uniref:alpha/beta fold hydrolase n=1 Tax=Telmatobacter bradus TaxID=474953 RepID=UPI003B42EBDA
MQITINNATINYEIAGTENEHPMIVLHGGRGFGTYPGVFRTFKPLADRYRVIGYDMRGHGHSSLTPPYSFNQLTDDLEQLRLKLGDGRPMILEGGSFGGMIALSYAVRYPHGLSHLILRGTAPSWHHELEAMENFRARAALKAPMATEKMLEKIFTPAIIDDNEFRLIMFALYPMYVEDGQPIDRDRILETARSGIYHARVHNDLFANHDYDVTDRLSEIKVPTLVLCGDSDWICPPSQSKLIAERIPHARLYMVPNCNHGVPDDVAVRETKAFLANHA